MSRKTFLTLAGAIGLLVGLVATLSPATILVGKGVAPELATMVWVREVGALILAASVLAILVRGHGDSPTMRAVLFANALLHASLFPIEIMAWRYGIITRGDGIVPNTILHVVLAATFVFYAQRVRAPAPA